MIKQSFCSLIGSNKHVQETDIQSLNIAGSVVHVSQQPINNLGGVFDKNLNMAAQVTKMVKSACFHLRSIGRSRHQLTTDTTRQLVQSLVISRLDYGNALLYGITDDQLKRLREVQHQAARLIFRLDKFAHITKPLKDLHWLPIDWRIQHKILCHMYKAVNKEGPSYLSELLTVYQPPRHLRSAMLEILEEPQPNLARVGSKAFSVVGPLLWNALPAFIRHSKSYVTFKSSLKTYYFKRAYP